MLDANNRSASLVAALHIKIRVIFNLGAVFLGRRECVVSISITRGSPRY